MDQVLGLEGYSDPVQVGQGGYGVVYRAVQDDLHRPVAVKILAGGPIEADAHRRFERERLALGALAGHPAIVTVHESGFNASGRPYLVMEFMSGGSLADRMSASGPLPWTEAVAIGAQIADGLTAAHEAGLLHRDVKPENLLVSQFGEVKLADFGIASLTEGSMSATHTVTATVAHAAPEVLEGAKPSVASDVYSLASTIYALITGRAAFRHETDESVVPMLARVLTAPVPDLRPQGVPDAVARVLERAMAKDPAERPQTANEFRAALQVAAAGAGVALPAAGPADTVQDQPSATVHDATPFGAGFETTDRANATVRRAGVAGAAAATPVAAVSATPFEARQHTVRRRRRTVGAIVAAVVVLAGAGIAIFALGGGGDSGNGDGAKAKVEVLPKEQTRRSHDTTKPDVAVSQPEASLSGTPIFTFDGTSEPDAIVTVVNTTNAVSQTVKPNAAGVWTQAVTLVPGENRITITARDPGRNERSVQRTVVYLPPGQPVPPTPVGPTTATTRPRTTGTTATTSGGVVQPPPPPPVPDPTVAISGPTGTRCGNFPSPNNYTYTATVSGATEFWWLDSSSQKAHVNERTVTYTLPVPDPDHQQYSYRPTVVAVNSAGRTVTRSVTITLVFAPPGGC